MKLGLVRPTEQLEGHRLCFVIFAICLSARFIEYFLIETTALDQDWSGAFIDGANGLLNNQGPTAGPITYKNRESWEEYLSVENTYLIDCNDSRVLGLTPFVN